MDKKLKRCFRRSGNFRTILYSHGGYLVYWDGPHVDCVPSVPTLTLSASVSHL